ncbi:hypothetical protein KOR42_53110 [Thalassoglobus neptunius]|uniref:Uncharacterized protein n=1 Tax=Thalassoglobus neptunius TaxID=1938619 RepID=A0A5C5V8W6_9PLAN|nr:hypothetical protein [Thalassoglobus neptunius]TWT35018.1 hypothetical protein KOR42_53110 [Thalassoglobus neptunius]
MQDIRLVQLSKPFYVNLIVVPVRDAQLFVKETMGTGEVKFAISIVLKEILS